MKLIYFAHPSQAEAAKAALGPSVEVVTTKLLPETDGGILEMEREIRAHNIRADAALLRKQRRAWKRSRPKQ